MRIFSTLALTAILAFAGFTLLSPAPVLAGAQCACLPGGMTPEGSGSGATCAEAEAQLIDSLEPYIDCGVDGDCSYTVYSTYGCRAAKIGVFITGRLRYKCWVCF